MVVYLDLKPDVPLLIMLCVFIAFYRSNVDKREALENLDLILLCLDEIVDGGYAYISVTIFLSQISLIYFLIVFIFP